MFRIISNIVTSIVRHASIAQRLDDAVTLSDGQREQIANLESELAYTYRRIEHMRFQLDEAEAAHVKVNREWSYSDEQVATITDDNAALRRSLAEMRAERDALRNEVATLHASATPRPASPDLDPFDGGCAADR